MLKNHVEGKNFAIQSKLVNQNIGQKIPQPASVKAQRRGYESENLLFKSLSNKNQSFKSNDSQVFGGHTKEQAAKRQSKNVSVEVYPSSSSNVTRPTTHATEATSRSRLPFETAQTSNKMSISKTHQKIDGKRSLLPAIVQNSHNGPIKVQN